MAEDPKATKSPGLRPLLQIVRFLGRYPGAVAASISLLLVNISIEMYLPRIIGQTITNLRWHLEWKAEFDTLPLVLLFASLVFIRAGVGFILGPIRNRLIQGTLADVRVAIFEALQRLSFSQHNKKNTGELISRSITDVGRMQDFFFACLLLLVDIFVAIALTLTLIFLIDPVSGWLAIGTMIPSIGLVAFYAAKLQPQWRKVHDLHSEMTTVIQENIAGVRVVKAFAREQQEIGKFGKRRDEFLEKLMFTVNYWASRVPFAQFVFGLGLPLALWVGGRQVIHGRLLIGELVSIVFYFMAIGNRMGAIGQFTNILQNAAASAERITEILNEKPSITTGHTDLPEGKGSIRFDKVSFSHTEGRKVLSDVSFNLPAGGICGVVGATGAGKSTLVQMIPRFYEAETGSIFLDVADVRTIQLPALRRSIGFVFQDSFLFSATILENIRYGRPEASREEVEQAAQAAEAGGFIAGLKEGYDTVVGERGVTLSGGQKQRLALARAFLMDPRVLILDDATASVDSETEHHIQDAVRKLRKGRTTFVIAQRASSLNDVDYILVLKEGKVERFGRREEILTTGETLDSLLR